MEIMTPRPLAAGERGNCILPEPGRKVLSSQISPPPPPLAFGCSDKSRTVASAGDWQLHTQELGPDLTEAGTFLEEGFSKECNPWLAPRRGAALTGLIGLPELCPVRQRNEMSEATTRFGPCRYRPHGIGLCAGGRPGNITSSKQTSSTQCLPAETKGKIWFPTQEPGCAQVWMSTGLFCGS